MMPATAPRRGKRLDTHWGEFGMLAAEYFSPLLFGEPAPASLGEAWGHIDQSILHFIFGKSGQNLSDTEKEPCKLVGYGDARVALLIMSNPTQLPGDDKPCTSSSEWEILSVVI
jgi:hypothetical protein